MAIQRLNYFNGQFLREADFKVEQGYHLSMRRTHNQRAHTAGIVNGLEVVAGSSQVTVRAGMAIDADGRELIVATDTAVPVTPGSANFYVVVALDERKTDNAADPDPIHTETRWTERPVFDVVAAVPAGAIGLAQIGPLSGSDAVALAAGYRRVYSAPAAGGDLTVGRDLTVMGNLEVKGQTGHSGGRVRFSNPLDVTGEIFVSGNVDGRDVSADGAKLDGHVASTANPHGTTAAQVDAQGGANRIVAQINAGTGVIADARIDSAIARASSFNAANGHDHDGADSKKVVPGNLEGVNASVTASALNILTGGPNSNAAALHTHPFSPADGTVNLQKLDAATRMRLLKVPLLSQSLMTPGSGFSLGGQLTGCIAFDGTFLWAPNLGNNSIHKIDPTTNAVTATLSLPAGSRPAAVVFAAGAVWVANAGGNTISRFDVVTNAVVATIGTRPGPVALAVGAFLWVACSGDDSVSKIDMASNTVVTTIAIAGKPAALLVVGASLWVACPSSNSVSKIDLTTNAVATVPVSNQPRALAATSATFLWVGGEGNNPVSKIDVNTNAVTSPITAAGHVYSMAVIGNILWVGFREKLQKFDTTSTTPHVPVTTVSTSGSMHPNALLVAAGFLWVCTSLQLHKVDPDANTVVATAWPLELRGMAFDGLYLWVARFGMGQVVKVDPLNGQVLATVDVGSRPHSIAYNGRHVFVTNSGSNSVSKIDPATDRVVATIAVGTAPTGIAVNPTYGTVWVANSGDNTASGFDANASSVGVTVPVGANPQAVITEGYYVCVANRGGTTITRMGGWIGGSVASTVTVPASPSVMVFDNTSVWVACVGSNILTKIPYNSTATTSVTFPAGVFPVRMCFNGAHLLVVATNNQMFKVDVFTNVLTSIPMVSHLGTNDPPTTLVFDGFYTWGTDTLNGTGWRMVA